jgi:hypothetical protein
MKQIHQPNLKEDITMGFFGEAVNTLSILVIALGAGLAVWGRH